MDNHSEEERNISTEDILKTLDRFGSKTPSPVEDVDDQFVSSGRSSQRLSFVDDPLSNQRLSFVSVDGSEIDSDYSSASSVVPASSEEQKNLELEWRELFGSSTYYAIIRQHALDGKLRFSNFRSICWKVFLECLPEQKDDWVMKTTKLRNDYTQFKNKCLFDPNKGKNQELDLTVFNPLSQDETSPWKQYFLDNEIKSTIKQDLDRLFPEIEFFQQSKIKEMMLNILFCHTKKNEALGYKQGMHELLAPVVYVLHEEAKIFPYLEGSNLKIAKFLMDKNFLEHDAFALFVQLMDQTETWYLQVPVPGLLERNKFLDPHAEPFADQDLVPSTAIVKKLNRIQEHMLRKYDPELWIHMKNLEITPQVYGLRWIRLLFGREFPMVDVLVLWDALFADGPMLDLVDYIYISMLEAIRDRLLAGSYSACMGYLMKFPGGFDDVYRYVKTALIMRENKPSSTRSSPRTSRHPAPHTTHASGTFPQRKKLGPKRPQSAFTSFTKRYQQFIEPVKQTVTKPAGKEQAQQVVRDTSHVEELVSRGSRPARPGSVSVVEARDRLDTGPQSNSPTNPAKGMKSIKGKLMARPRTRSRVDYDELAQDHERLQRQVSSLKSELDKVQGMYLYCGRKMDSYIDLLQDELTKEEDRVGDVVYLCLAGLKQVRDLLKGTLAFRGSTMETECDFMEIDNNIAARLQVSSVQRPKSSELPESLPVPMLANFGHFEETDEKESSFMTTNEDKNASGETEVSADEPTPGLLPTNTQREEELKTDNVEAGVSKASSENPELGGDSTQNVTDQDADFEADAGKPFLNIGDLHHSINPIGSNPLFGEEDLSSKKMEEFNDNFNRTSEPLFPALELTTDNEFSQLESTTDQRDVQGGEDSSRVVTQTDSLFDVFNELSVGASEKKETGDENNDALGGKRETDWRSPLFGTDSPSDREFVFVNRDGTAQSSPQLSRHPLENSGEFFY